MTEVVKLMKDYSAEIPKVIAEIQELLASVMREDKTYDMDTTRAMVAISFAKEEIKDSIIDFKIANAIDQEMT